MSYTIINFRPKGTDLSSSEYIKKKTILDITKTHGLGSGIYGIIDTKDESYKQKSSTRPREIQTSIPIDNPLILNTNNKFAKFTQLSRYLINLCESQINKKKDKYNTLAASLQEYETIRIEICPLSNTIITAYKNFMAAYKNAVVGDFLRQPINYLLEPNYKGIYNSCSNGNTFTSGSVVFIHQRPRHQKHAFDNQPFLLEGNKLIGGTLNSRQSPLIQAKHFKLNNIKTGLNKEKWICAKRINGVKYWKQL